MCVCVCVRKRWGSVNVYDVALCGKNLALGL